jgi:hypothetical protein
VRYPYLTEITDLPPPQRHRPAPESNFVLLPAPSKDANRYIQKAIGIQKLDRFGVKPGKVSVEPLTEAHRTRDTDYVTDFGGRKS